MPVPADIALMHPTLIAHPFHREGWVYEEKYDGWRILAHKADGRVQLLSRNGRDHARRFGELASAMASLPESTLILDDEVAIFDEQLVSRFEWLRHGTATRSPRLPSTWPLMRCKSEPAISALSRSMPAARCWRASWRVNACSCPLDGSQGVAWRHGRKWSGEVHEGLVAKDEASPYISGRTLSWLKVKQPEYRVSSRGFQSR